LAKAEAAGRISQSYAGISWQSDLFFAGDRTGQFDIVVKNYLPFTRGRPEKHRCRAVADIIVDGRKLEANG
jgi:hypothetical protein